MTTAFSIPLTVRFEVVRPDDGLEPRLEIALASVEPRGVFVGAGAGQACASCTDGIGTTGKCCDACAVEMSISELGADYWLELLGLGLEVGLRARRGRRVLEIQGTNRWMTHHGLEGTDYDEEFEVTSWRWA